MKQKRSLVFATVTSSNVLRFIIYTTLLAFCLSFLTSCPTPVEIIPKTVPEAPSSLSATVVSSSQINLSWTDNSNNETGFTIGRSPDGSSSWTQVATTSANVTTYSNTGLAANTKYYYSVCATNAVGTSSFSNTVNATTQSTATVPGIPVSLSATVVSSNQINLSWTDNSNNETGFKIERSPNGSSSWAQIGTASANVTTYSSTGLAAGTKYYYRICATNAVGNSSYSNVANATTKTIATVPTTPGSLSATVVSSSQINLSWTDNSNNETGFKIERSPNGSSSWTQIATPSADATTYSSTELAAGTKYYYRVCATNAVGNSSYSNIANATTKTIATVPTTPSSLSATVVSSSQINLSWTDNSNNETGFKIERSPNGSSSWTQITMTSANATTYSNTGLAAGTKYYYRVCATNAVGNSSYSNIANATTKLLTITLRPQYDNLLWNCSMDENDANTVYRFSPLGIGVNWLYSSITGIQDYLACASLIKFDTSQLYGKTIDSATLYLTTESCGVGYFPRTWSIRAMASNWSTLEITWNLFEKTDYYLSSKIDFNPPTYVGQVFNIDLRTIVQYWANGTYANHGLGLQSNDYTFPNTTSFDAFEFYSNEDTGGDHPVLIVTYH